MEKRLPGPNPEPQLVEDLVHGVGTVANDVVGVVTTAVSDVAKLLSPESAAVTTTAQQTNPGSTEQATPTTASPNASPPTQGGGSSSGGSSSQNGEAPTPPSASSSSGNDDSTVDGSTSGAGSGSSQVSGPSSSSSNIGASTNTGANTASGSVLSGSSTGTTQSGTGVVNIVSGSTVSSGASPSPIINAAHSAESDPASGSTISSGARSSGTLTGSSHRSSSSTATGPGSGDNDDGLNGNGASAANGSALSPGAIAGIVIACALVLIFLIVFILRKWHRQRRARRFENWASRPGAFSFFGGAAVSVNSEKERSIGGGRSGLGSGSGSGTRSARSSFGTSHDQGLRPITPDSFFGAPSPVSVSEIHASTNTPTSFLTAPLMPPPLALSVDHSENTLNRGQTPLTSSSSSYETEGIAGGRSRSHVNTSTEAVADEGHGSVDGHAQYLVAPVPQGPSSPGGAQLSPISVRPWSPSERWAFPKPPRSTAQSTVYSPAPSPPSQTGHIEQFAPSSQVSLSAVTPAAAGHDPFADPTQANSAEDASVTGHGAVESSATSMVEQIRRPFIPTLADELAVNRGDSIRVLQAFDDGWVQIEVLSRANADSGNSGSSSSAEPERGLIPVDCLREAGEALPTFLASRRVSSYYGGVAL